MNPDSFIVMASSNEFARKILNSPAFAEPCLVHSAKAVLRPDNWLVVLLPPHPLPHPLNTNLNAGCS